MQSAEGNFFERIVLIVLVNEKNKVILSGFAYSNTRSTIQGNPARTI